ncbi:cell division protein Fic [Candidatus Omnitrophus magneticus]|uniref:Cell division protein Fic n=1 Tax=Candidatus Omnitrophus magneticus TaxID=1609969 RepID=A0A0F0CL78_9BACT|nr:cell division protein Fic [Candidatus Omnitrophus magneticus]
MNSFKKKNVELPLSAVWLTNSISEYKGKQDIYTKQTPQVLKTLFETALIESAESSNRIEGVTIDRARLKPLLIGHSRPRDRSEEEVAGYRKALDLIHKKYKSISITPEIIQEFHSLCRNESWDAGKWKEKDNDIIRKNPDGRVEVIFRPVSAAKTPEMMEQLCLSYEYSISQLKYPDLYAVACLVLDFLSIHPFRDGNGRVSRLLTLLALYQHGFMVGKYISIERIIENSKETYYENLNKSSQKWHDARHDVIPWLNYFLGTVLTAYKEFEIRARNINSLRGTKKELVIQVINSQHGEFTISDIERACPSVSRVMIKKVLLQMHKARKIKGIGIGQSARWKRMVY